MSETHCSPAGFHVRHAVREPGAHLQVAICDNPGSEDIVGDPQWQVPQRLSSRLVPQRDMIRRHICMLWRNPATPRYA